MGHTKPSKQDGRVLGTPDDHYLFVAPSKTRLMMIGLLMLSLVALGYGIYVLSTVGGRPAMVLCVGAAVVTVAVWGGLQARIPQRIEVDRAVITIVHNGKRDRYDLEDPGVELRVRDGEIAFAHYMKPWNVVQARDVDWPVFTNVVMHYQNNADVNAELRDQRFSR